MLKSVELSGARKDKSTSGTAQYNRSFHLTNPLVTHLAGARSAPNVFAGEPNVRLIYGLDF